MSAQSLVKARMVQEAQLLRKRPVEWHAYGYPFVPVYAGWVYLRLQRFDDVFGSAEFATLALILVVALHALSFLVCKWSIRARAALTCIAVIARNGSVGAHCGSRQTHASVLYRRKIRSRQTAS